MAKIPNGIGANLVCLFLATAAAALCMNHHFEKEKNNEPDDT